MHVQASQYSNETERCQALESMGWNTVMVSASKNETFFPIPPQGPSDIICA